MLDFYFEVKLVDLEPFCLSETVLTELAKAIRTVLESNSYSVAEVSVDDDNYLGNEG